MTLTTVDALLAGAKPPVSFLQASIYAAATNKPQSHWPSNGYPGPGVVPSSGLAGNSLVAPVQGAVAIPQPGSSAESKMIRFAAQSDQTGVVTVCDRLWNNSGISLTSTALQTINSVALPARDNNGSINGEGVLAGLEILTATGAGTPTITLTYTNSDGTTGRTATLIDSAASTENPQIFHRFGLQGGDKGIKSIQSIQLSATWTSGTVSLVLYRPIASIEFMVAGYGNSLDALQAGFPKLFDGTCLFHLWHSPTAAVVKLSGQHVVSIG